jgi:hypothetical protein
VNKIVPLVATNIPALYGFFEFFTANIRNPHTRRAYARAAVEFLNDCADENRGAAGADIS